MTPKNGKARTVAMAPGLASVLFDLLTARRQEAMQRGWPTVPEAVFCSETGTPLDERNATRTWLRLRRRAHARGVRPLKLHSARHTFATLALQAGRSIRWVADQLGHSNPAFTLKTYAHAMPLTEEVLAFADFDGPKRPWLLTRKAPTKTPPT